MTDIVTPTPIDALPPAPRPTDTPAEFDARSFALLGALDPMVTQANAAIASANTNATAAKEQADAAALSHKNAVADTTAIKNAAVADTTAIKNAAVADTTAIKNAAVADTTAIKNDAITQTGLIRDKALEYRDSAALSASAAQASANFKGDWSALTGALNTPATVRHAGKFWVLLANLANVTTAEPGVSASWAKTGASTPRIAYADRATLRSAAGAAGDQALIEGLGLFVFTASSTEPDDDESCFAATGGCWLLEAVHWDVVDAWQLPDADMRDGRLEDLEARRPLLGTAVSSITSVASVSQVSFTGVVTGAAVGDRVIATPPNALGPRIAYFAAVTAADTVTVYLNNPSAAAQTLASGAWGLAVIK
jgi:hypothetical protein